MQLNGQTLEILKTREIFKVQVGLNVEDKVLVYNKDRDHGIEVDGARASHLIHRLALSKWGKRKTYVYGKFLPTSKTIQLEAEGELPQAQMPDW